MTEAACLAVTWLLYPNRDATVVPDAFGCDGSLVEAVAVLDLRPALDEPDVVAFPNPHPTGSLQCRALLARSDFVFAVDEVALVNRVPQRIRNRRLAQTWHRAPSACVR